MSPSWTKVLRTAPARMAGIAIGRDHVVAVVLTGKGGQPALHSHHSQPLPARLFDGSPDAAAEDALARALLAVSAEFRELYAPVHVALPDSVLRSTVFELDQLPKKAQLRQSLLRWRFARQWQRSEDSIDCRGADLGPDGAHHLHFGQGGDSAWLACVRRALARAGVSPWSMNAAAVYRYNGFHDQVAGAAGALLALDPDSWSLLLWDDKARVRQVLTRLRDSQAGGDEAAVIADEAERAILSYVQADSRRHVGRLHLAGSRIDTTALAGVFDARLREPVRVLRADAGIDAKFEALLDGLAPLALVAALSP